MLVCFGAAAFAVVIVAVVELALSFGVAPQPVKRIAAASAAPIRQHRTRREATDMCSSITRDLSSSVL
jgi:hypothetical protein